MFVLVERVDVIPETRVLVNTEHIVAAVPTGGGIRTTLHLAIGQSWEISLPFARAIEMLRDDELPNGTETSEEAGKP